jgi:hypothetical protein
MRDPLGHASQRREAGQAAAPGDHERGVEIAGGVGDGTGEMPGRVEDHRLGSRRGHDLRRMLGEAGPERRLAVTRADDGDMRSVSAGDPLALVILGSILVLSGAGLLLGGGALGVIHLTQRDDDGFVESPREQVASDGYAVTAEGVDIADLDDGGDWLVEQGLGRVRIRATSRTHGVFVGIAREADVDRYLAGTSYDELREVRAGADRYVSREGGAPPSAPGDAGIWVASAAGEGTQTVEWDARDGRWAVVVMNENGAAPVAADVSVGAKLGVLPWIAGGQLLAGLLSMAVGAGLIGVAVRGQPATTPAVADTVSDLTYPVTVDGPLDP